MVKMQTHNMQRRQFHATRVSLYQTPADTFKGIFRPFSPECMYEALVRTAYDSTIVGHIFRDSTATGGGRKRN